MKTELYWIEGLSQGRLAILPRPRGGDWLEDEIRAWRLEGLEVVVSVLTSGEITDLDLTQEASLCQANDLLFLSFPIVDRSVPPSRSAALEFVKELDHLLAQGKSIGIHCRQGIGRSALLAASLLVLSGSIPEVAFRQVSAARGCTVPETSEQRLWVEEFASLRA